MNFNELELRGVAGVGIIVTLNLHRENNYFRANSKTCIFYSRVPEKIEMVPTES